MPLYTYKALRRDDNSTVTGKVEAPDAYQARKKVKEMDLLPTLIVDTAADDTKKRGLKFIPKGHISSLSLREKIDFTSTLEILTSTGIPIIEALLFVEQNSDSKNVRALTHEFRKQIIGGSTLGETLEKYRNIFGRVYIGLVKAGEDSGELDKTLVRMLELLKKQDAVKGKVIGALIYPAVVFPLLIFLSHFCFYQAFLCSCFSKYNLWVGKSVVLNFSLRPTPAAHSTSFSLQSNIILSRSCSGIFLFIKYFFSFIFPCIPKG